MNLKMGKFSVLKGISSNANVRIKRRLLELGFTKGQSVRIIKKSLLGKTVLVQVRGYILSLRKELAELLEVEI